MFKRKKYFSLNLFDRNLAFSENEFNKVFMEMNAFQWLTWIARFSFPYQYFPCLKLLYHQFLKFQCPVASVSASVRRAGRPHSAMAVWSRGHLYQARGLNPSYLISWAYTKGKPWGVCSPWLINPRKDLDQVRRGSGDVFQLRLPVESLFVPCSKPTLAEAALN